MARWGILGGGMLGMTLAHRLARAGEDVSLCEAAPELGGLASAWSLGDVVWDRHYHVTLLSDFELRALLTELDLESTMQWVTTRTGFYAGGRLISLSDSLEFLRFPLLTLSEKIRLAATILRASSIKNWKPLEQIPVADWLARWSGPTTVEKIWLPLLRSKLGDNYRTTSAAFIWATIARMYAARRSGLKKELFGYVPGGYANILRRFGAVLAAEGVRVELNSRTVSVQSDGAGSRVFLADGRRLDFDRVILTMPSPTIAQAVQGLSPAETERLTSIRYQGIICASVLLDRPLSSYYVTNLVDPGLPFTAVIEMSALVDRRQFGGGALVYLPKYVDESDASFNVSDEAIRDEFSAALARMYPDFSPDRIRAFRVSRVRRVFALSTLGYSERVPPIRTSVPGVYVVNSSQIVNGTLNVNETVRLANRAAQSLLGEPPVASDASTPGSFRKGAAVCDVA